MNEIVAEFIGTFLLILLGNGVVANVVLNDTKGHNSGWIVISLGWGLGVFVGVAVAGPVSGAHINPAVSIGLAAAGLFPWLKVLPFILAQMMGAMTGAFTVWLFYRHHFNRTNDSAAQLGCFSTAPAIRKTGSNFISETIGTFVLIFVILYIAEPSVALDGVWEHFRWHCLSQPLASHWVEQPVMPSILPVTWVHASCTRFYPWIIKGAATGPMHGFLC